MLGWKGRLCRRKISGCHGFLLFNFNYLGKDIIYSGVTGDSFQCYIYTGPIYYQMLKHMVQDKMHGGACGLKTVLTRQPTGDMVQVICWWKDYKACEVDICNQCGRFGYQNWCNSCKSSSKVSNVTITYGFKLLVDEL